MQYRTLGNTGLRVSQLGFGAMRLPMRAEGDKQVVDRDLAIPMIHRAFEAGVNYIDTAIMYCDDDSQRAVGEALKGWRDKIVVSTKNHFHEAEEGEWRRHLENSLERLDVDYIDIYNHHGVNWKLYQNRIEPHLSKWMQKAKDEGLIKHICCSFHDDNEGLKHLVESGYPEVITLQYNMLDRQLEEGIALAASKGIGVVSMGPVGGGRLGEESETLAKVLPEIKRIPELALRFVLANPNISVALSGMSTMQHVEENTVTSADNRVLTTEEMEIIHNQMDRLKRMAELYCTGCGYCMPCEAASVHIPHIFGLFNQGRIYGLWQNARNSYGGIGVHPPFHKHAKADACTECGECEEKCPQNIQIRAQLKEAHKALGQRA
jgi:uncharacterized protein